jgi:D-tyrosyl-tRNA(Tyr) deacylase
MRALIQRVREASVRVGDRTVGAIGPGLVVLAAIAEDDGDEDRDWLARKIVALRIFDDDDGVMNRSIIDTGGAILAVSSSRCSHRRAKAAGRRGRARRRRWSRSQVRRFRRCARESAVKRSRQASSAR